VRGDTRTYRGCRAFRLRPPSVWGIDFNDARLKGEHGQNTMRLLHVTLAAFSVALLASDAQSDTLTGSYSGFVSATPVSGRQYFDLGNFFGLGANASLGGLPISGTFTYDSTQNQGNLSSAIRLFVLNFYREKLEIHDKHDVIEVVLCSPILTLH
jgi:hypothetical protein